MSTNIVYLSDLRQRPRLYTAFERRRHTSIHWFVELFAEAVSALVGVGSQALYVLGNILKVQGASSILQIGLSYACGILLALGAITITQMLFHGFPPLKGLRYMAAQIFGGYIACLLVYVQYKTLILEAEAALLPAGPGVSALAANAARDVGGRLAALTIWGMPAAGGSYAALAALTNIPATLLACVVYELMLSDSDRVVPAAHLDVINVHKNHRRLGGRPASPASDPNLDGKGHVGEVERV
ncbi:hypothetical protein B0H17DRAFT_1061320 [Mycena rosella]|uniref:Aquaporin-like protein n=1 Tax=Mycena rosella TaxID=1033263 RepID=A0AAD7DJA6_MYCRO|nr:hypothetical protein B0H17DRAFT_1061320 [Mycena rosella]